MGLVGMMRLVEGFFLLDLSVSMKCYEGHPIQLLSHDAPYFLSRRRLPSNAIKNHSIHLLSNHPPVLVLFSDSLQTPRPRQRDADSQHAAYHSPLLLPTRAKSPRGVSFSQSVSSSSQVYNLISPPSSHHTRAHKSLIAPLRAPKPNKRLIIFA